MKKNHKNMVGVNAAKMEDGGAGNREILNAVVVGIRIVLTTDCSSIN